MPKSIVAAGAAAALVLALAAGFSLGGSRPRDASAAPPASADPAEPLRRLEEALREERSVRRALEVRVADLEARLSEAAAPLAAGAEDGAPVVAEAEADDDESARSADDTSGSLEEQLLAAGFNPADVRAYRERVDAIQLDRLYLRDQAKREGWHGTPRYNDAKREISAALRGTREEFGDELYDWALYASGRPNRVKVSAVMSGSAAAAAGFQPGDVLVRYGDRPIFSPRELREQTHEGRAGTNTAVEVVRNGEPVRLFVPRGPLGVRTGSTALEPGG